MPPLPSIRPPALIADSVRLPQRSIGFRRRVGAQRPRGLTPGHAFTALPPSPRLPPSLCELRRTGRQTDRKRGCASGRAFTLLEILLCLALIALLGGVLIGGSSHLLSEQPVTPHGLFWKAVQEARKSALKSQREVRLKYDGDKKQFLLVDGLAPATLAEDGRTRIESPLKVFPVPAETAGDLTIDFLAASAKGGNAILVGGVLLEARPVPFVSFYPDGTCTPFRAQFARSGGSTILAIDPWTCAPVLNATDSHASGN
jgi:hypothetical protein